MLKLQLTDRVRVPVDVLIPTDTDRPIKGSFVVILRRQTTDQIVDIAQEMLTDVDAKRLWMKDNILEVRDLLGEDDQPVSLEQALTFICNEPALLDQVPAQLFNALRGITAKNSARRR